MHLTSLLLSACGTALAAIRLIADWTSVVLQLDPLTLFWPVAEPLS